MANTPGGLPKSEGDVIYGADYNAVQAKVRQALGDGFPYGPIGSGDVSYGYNQSLNSSQMSTTCQVIAPQWNALIGDVNKAYCHVFGSDYTNYTASVNGEISAINLNSANTAIDTVLSGTNRYALGVGQSTKAQAVVATGQPITYGVSWGGTIYCTFDFIFSSDNAMQYFFNQGGKLHIEGTGPNQVTNQDAAWKAMMDTFRLEFYVNGNTTQGVLETDETWGTSIGYTNATPAVVYDIYQQKNAGTSGGGSYTDNVIQVRFRKLLSSQGGPKCRFQLSYYDYHTEDGGGPDTVSANIGFYAYATRASGSFTGIPPVGFVVGAGWST